MGPSSKEKCATGHYDLYRGQLQDLLLWYVDLTCGMWARLEALGFKLFRVQSAIGTVTTYMIVITLNFIVAEGADAFKFDIEI